MRVSKLSDFGLLLFLVTGTASSLVLAPLAMAAQHGGPPKQGEKAHHCPEHHLHGAHKGHAGHHGMGAQKGRHGQGAHKGRHGAHHRQGGHHGKKTLFGPHWKTTLSPEQATEMDRIRVEYMKRKLPLKAKARAVKLELLALATADEPDTAAVKSQIDALLDVKRETMRLKYNHIAAKRRLLTPEQRVSFDMDVLKRAKSKGKKRH